MIAFPNPVTRFTKSLAPRLPEAAVLYEVRHVTAYAYDQIIRSSEHQLRLTPLQDAQQGLCDFALHLTPRALIKPFIDSYGNEVLHLRIHEPYQQLQIETESLVAVSSQDPITAWGLEHPIAWRRGEWEALQHLMIPEALPERELAILNDYAQTFLSEQRGAIIPTIDAINQAIFRDFRYKPGSTVIGTSVFEVFEKRQGVCQDFTNLMICLLRLLQLPALYRTGYIYTGLEQNMHIAADASHAWVEVYLPRIGWCGWDPTNGARAGADHIRLAAGRTSSEATPTSGTIYTPFQTETLTVHVGVKRRGVESPSSAISRSVNP